MRSYEIWQGLNLEPRAGSRLFGFPGANYKVKAIIPSLPWAEVYWTGTALYSNNSTSVN